MQTLSIRTGAKNQFLEITDQVRKVAADAGVRDGLVTVYVPHTTAGVTINENADPDVEHDMLGDLARLVPEQEGYYRHYEGNSASHLKASLMGASAVIPLEEGRMILGRWQGIYLCEFDGPRTRRVMIHILSQESSTRS